MELKNAIRTYFESLNAKEGCKVFPSVMAFQVETSIGHCNVMVNLQDFLMNVNFFHRPQDAINVFDDQRVDMVGTKQHFLDEIKEHFDFIFASIAENAYIYN